MTALSVVGAVAAVARDHLHRWESGQAWQHRRVASSVVGDLNSPDFQGGRSQCLDGPCTICDGSRSHEFSFPLAFAQHLGAGTVDQQM